MQEQLDAFDTRGIGVVAVGQGTGVEAAGFAQEWGVEFPVLGDSRGDAYRAYHFTRGNLWSVVLRGMVERPLESLHAIARANWRGAILASSDVMRLGGVALVDKGGALRSVHRAEGPADIPSNAELLAAFDAG